MSIRGYRKFGLAVGVIVIATTMLIWGKLSGSEFVTLVSWVSGLFFGANGAQAVGEKLAQKQPGAQQ